ncbi:MAG TPA: NAD(P)H-dependent oxidoreductase [Microlunatus sp.]
MSDVVAVSGNPRLGSRTHQVGLRIARRVADELGLSDSITELEVIRYADGLFSWGDQRPEGLTAALDGLRHARLAVIATPVYKAGYTGLLKSFLDHFQAGELSSVVAIPVVVAGSPAHTFVGDLYLRPLLTEIGAVVPTPAFTVSEGQLDGLDEVVGRWTDRHLDALGRQLGSDTTGQVKVATSAGR